MARDFGNAQDLVLIQEIRGSTVVMQDGGLRQVLLVSGVNTALKSETELNVLVSSYQNFLNGLDFPVQIVVHSRKVNIEKYLKALEGRVPGEASPLLQNQIVEYSKFIKSFVEENAIMEKIFLFVVPFVPIALPSAQTVSHLIPFLGKSKADEAQAKEERETAYNESLEQLTQRVTQVTEGLRAVGVEAVALNNEELIELFYNFYNPETVQKEEMTLPQTK